MTSQGRCLIKARKCFGMGAEFCLTLGVHPKTWVQLGCYKTSGALLRALKLAVSTVDYQSVTPEMFAVTAEVAAFIITAHHVPPSSSTSCRERRRSSPWCKIGTIAIGRTAAPLSCITTDSSCTETVRKHHLLLVPRWRSPIPLYLTGGSGKRFSIPCPSLIT